MVGKICGYNFCIFTIDKFNNPPIEMNCGHNLEIIQLVRQFEEMIKTGSCFYFSDTEFHKLTGYYLEAQEYSNALKVAREAVSQHPFNVDFLLDQADCYLQLKDWDKALQTTDSAEQIAPGNFEVLYNKAKILIHQKLVEEASLLIENLKTGADNEELSRIYYLEGLVNEVEEDYEEMFESLKYSLLCNPHNEEALSKIWVCTEIINAYPASIELYQHILNKDPYSYMAWYNLAQAYSCEGEYDQALTAYEYSYLIEPGFAFGYQDRGELLFQLGRYEEALECYEEWNDVSRPDSEVLTMIGHCLLKLKQYEQAFKVLTKAKKLDTYDDEIYFLLGKCHYKRGEYLSAIKNYQKALKIEELREEYYVAMASSYARLGEYAKADYYFTKAEEIGPDQSYIWKKHSFFLFSIGEYQNALDIIEEGIENTMDPELMYTKAGMLVKGERTEEGMITLEEALMLNYEENGVFHKIVEGVQLDEKILSMFRFFAPQSS